MPVNTLEVGLVNPFAGRCQVNCLAANHAGRAGCAGENPDHLQPLAVRPRKPPCIAEQLKCKGLQGVTGQYGAGFVKSDVGGGLATAQVIIVHGRQVVVYQ